MPEGAVLRGSLSERRPGDVVETFTILTTEANATMQALRHRMPVILAHEASEQWLSGDDVALSPALDDLLAMHWVSTHVNHPRNDEADCVAILART